MLQLDSFSLWLVHRKIRFTANNFFTVDLTLVYAVSTAERVRVHECREINDTAFNCYRVQHKRNYV